ncbi:MAG TPA: citrate/2-methylcitrate synthase, partial [Acidimicrobiales bacterium]|nr:citrate/2-methylcitrate synthase [Acidimicrobiales bacterium]
MAESITVTDNRTGEAVEIPIVDGGVSADDFRKLLPGVWFQDPAFMTTSVAASAITYLDGDAGILRYRGYPIEQLAEHSTHLEVAYLLLNGELPTSSELDAFTSSIAAHATVDADQRARFLSGFPRDAHPMGVLVASLAELGTEHPESKAVTDPAVRAEQIARIIGVAPTLAATAYRASQGKPFVAPDPALSYTENFLRMMWEGDPDHQVDPVLSRALEVLFILHADHEQNCGTLAMRTVGSSHADPYSSAAAAAAALYGPRHGGANEAVLKMLTEIGSIDNVDDFIADVKAGKGKLQGFGHRVYKNYDPRAKIVKKTADEVFTVTGKNPLLDIALKLEEVALSDEYFVSRKLYPNVDFYSGLIYQ